MINLFDDTNEGMSDDEDASTEATLGQNLGEGKLRANLINQYNMRDSSDTAVKNPIRSSSH